MGIITIILWAMVVTVLIKQASSMLFNGNTVEISYSEFIQMVEENQVASVEIQSNKFLITPKDDPEETDPVGLGDLAERVAQGKTVTYVAPTLPVEDPDLLPLLKTHGVAVDAPLVDESSYLLGILLSYVVPVLIMIFLFSFLFKNMAGKMGGGLGGLGGVGKANAKVYVEKKTGVTFADVAGQDEAKESLEEIIDFLHSPLKYTEIGAKLPKGALLVGSPGTGKTLLAKAVAGEANVPFFSISGSDFVEMFVGVGASRVRDLFKEAAKMAPCIIFIDEIDTIGKSRDNRMGGNDEREQTLNQLLAELDGFDPTKGVIVLAATNRPEVLDKALLRPGRFDRRITVDRPNLAGRLATLQVHTRNIRLAEDVNLNRIAQATAGAVGADLANLVNEAALRAVRLGRKAVNQSDLLVSFEVVIAGTEKKGTVLTESEKRMIAYHEVGHALVATMQKHAQPVSKITIVPHTQGALGYTMQMPEEEKFLMTEDDLLTEIRTLLAGRAAEEVVFQSKSSGAANDIERATDLARKMVAMFGMSERFGMMGLATVQNQYLDGGYGLNCAQDTAAAIDQEVRTIIERCHTDALRILEENRAKLDEIATYLLKKETITGGEMMAILEGSDPSLAEDVSTPRESPSTLEPPKVIPLAGHTPAPGAGPDDTQADAPGD
ncbi:MAG: ATP-dependent zinc metalloprotease FtsH [Clostridiales bacterium]|nr:ATP-dependent zinc metalloprotease FtsH [Clostridiales bacterium]